MGFYKVDLWDKNYKKVSFIMIKTCKMNLEWLIQHRWMKIERKVIGSKDAFSKQIYDNIIDYKVNLKHCTSCLKGSKLCY